MKPSFIISRIRGHVARSNLGDANEKRDWRIYRDFANSLIAQARRLYADDAFAVDLDNTVYALTRPTIDLSLKVFPWAHFRKARSCREDAHARSICAGNIPSFIHVSDGKMHEVNILDLMVRGTRQLLDDGSRFSSVLFRVAVIAVRSRPGACLRVIRPKSNTALRRSVFTVPSIKPTRLALRSEPVRLTRRRVSQRPSAISPLRRFL